MAKPLLDELLIEQNPDAVVFANRQGEIAVWNTAAEKMFGFTKDQAIGASLDIIIPESLREAHWKGYERALQEAGTKYLGQALPTKSVRADGSSFYVELSFSIIVDSSGAVLGALSNARDITERFVQDRANRKRLRELENSVAGPDA